MSRFSVQPGDVPAQAAARRMGMSLNEFVAVLPNLVARGFPKPDPDTHNFDLDAIDAWRRARHSIATRGASRREDLAGALEGCGRTQVLRP